MIQAALDWKPQPIQLLGPGAGAAPLGDRTVEGGLLGDRTVEGRLGEEPCAEDKMEVEAPLQVSANARVSRYLQSGNRLREQTAPKPLVS